MRSESQLQSQRKEGYPIRLKLARHAILHDETKCHCTERQRPGLIRRAAPLDFLAVLVLLWGVSTHVNLQRVSAGL